MDYFKAVLTEKKQLAPEVTFFRFELDDEKDFKFQAGQYLILLIQEQRRLYSIASPESRSSDLELVVKLLPSGVGSDYLRSLEIESPIYFRGPAGLFTLRSADKPKIFLAGGTGIAPIRSQIVSYLEKGGQAPLRLFWGLKRKEDVYFYDELATLAQKYHTFQFQICLDQENSFAGLHVDYFKRGRVDKAFQDYLKENRLAGERLNEFEYYLCAGREIVESLKGFLESLGVKTENIFFDKF